MNHPTTIAITDTILRDLWKTLNDRPDTDSLTRFVPLIERDLHVRDAVVLAMADTQVDETAFLAMARQTDRDAERRAHECLERVFSNHGSVDRPSVLGMARLFRQTGERARSSQAHAVASCLALAAGDPSLAVDCAARALRTDDSCTLAAIVMAAITYGI